MLSNRPLVLAHRGLFVVAGHGPTLLGLKSEQGARRKAQEQEQAQEVGLVQGSRRKGEVARLKAPRTMRSGSRNCSDETHG